MNNKFFVGWMTGSLAGAIAMCVPWWASVLVNLLILSLVWLTAPQVIERETPP